MIYTAKELKAKLNHLVLAGQNKDGELEFIGKDKAWRKADEEDLRDEHFEDEREKHLKELDSACVPDCNQN